MLALVINESTKRGGVSGEEEREGEGGVRWSE